MSKKNVLILGSSHRNSIGTLLGNQLQKDGYHVTLSSRHQCLVCDVTNPKQVERTLRSTSPDIIICCVGTFISPQSLGKITSWNKILDHLVSRTLGSIVLLNTVIKHSMKSDIIFITGKTSSKDPSFGPYIMANAAIAQLKQFASALFPKLRINVIAYPAIEGTYMIEAYKRKTGQSFPTISISKAYQKLKKYLV